VFYELSDFEQGSSFGTGDDGALITNLAAEIQNKGGGVLRIGGSLVLDTPINIYQGVSLQFAGPGASVLKIREAECALIVKGKGIGDLGIGGFVSGFSIEGPANRVGVKRVGTRTHTLSNYVISDLDLGELLTSRDDGDPDKNVPSFGSAFNHTEKAVFKRCKVGQHIDKGPSYSNRNNIQALYQGCDTGLIIEGSGTNAVHADCQGNNVGVIIRSKDGKDSNRNLITFRNENKNQPTQLQIGSGSKANKINGVYNPAKVQDDGRQTVFY
jgi:hypothetical protein